MPRPKVKRPANQNHTPKVIVYTRAAVACVVVLIFTSLCWVNLYLAATYTQTDADADGYTGGTTPLRRGANWKRLKIANIDNNATASLYNDRVLEYFSEAGVKLDEKDLLRLPTWDQIESLIGAESVVLGLDRCEMFQKKVPALHRMLGASGMFNSGTNLVSLAV
jgi:hypothetical protein